MHPGVYQMFITFHITDNLTIVCYCYSSQNQQTLDFQHWYTSWYYISSTVTFTMLIKIHHTIHASSLFHLFIYLTPSVTQTVQHQTAEQYVNNILEMTWKWLWSNWKLAFACRLRKATDNLRKLVAPHKIQNMHCSNISYKSLLYLEGNFLFWN